MTLKSRAIALQSLTQYDRGLRTLLAVSICTLTLPSCGSSRDDTATHTSPGTKPDAEETSEAEADTEPLEPDAPDSGESSFSKQLYLEMLCNMYTSCSPALRGAYGSREQCLSYTTKLYEVRPFELPTFSEPEWDAQCLANLTRQDFPSGDPEDVLAVQQHVFGALFACARPELMACNDNDDCLDPWQCSTTDGSCGTCQRPALGMCRHPLECTGGDHCIAGVCNPAKLEGSACGDPNECVSNHCTDGVCNEVQPEGGSCAVTTDCEPYLWCKQGVCTPPAAPGERCAEGVAEDVVVSCQYGYLCAGGRCQELGFSDVAVGEPCLYSGSCVSGAECLGSVCVKTDDECVDDAQCAAGQYCDAACLPKATNGKACRNRNACVSDYCSDDHVCDDGNPCD